MNTNDCGCCALRGSDVVVHLFPQNNSWDSAVLVSIAENLCTQQLIDNYHWTSPGTSLTDGRCLLVSRKRNKSHLCKAVPLSLNIYSRKTSRHWEKKKSLSCGNPGVKNWSFFNKTLSPVKTLNLFLGAELITRGSFSFNSLRSWEFCLCACKDILNLLPQENEDCLMWPDLCLLSVPSQGLQPQDHLHCWLVFDNQLHSCTLQILHLEFM